MVKKTSPLESKTVVFSFSKPFGRSPRCFSDHDAVLLQFVETIISHSLSGIYRELLPDPGKKKRSLRELTLPALLLGKSESILAAASLALDTAAAE